LWAALKLTALEKTGSLNSSIEVFGRDKCPSGSQPTTERSSGMTSTLRLEQADGTSAEPPTIKSTVTNWRTGDTIPLGRDRSLRVVGIVVTDENEPPTLIVEDVS
jgi:hypothetical protein